MKSVYIVTWGYYSDYHIVSVFSTKELAESFCEGMKSKSYDYEIEEYGLDCGVDYINHGLFCYEVHMDHNGDSLKVVVREEYDFVGQVKFYMPGHAWALSMSRRQGGAGYGESGIIIALFYVLARNEEHAIKVANEKRVQLLLTNSWGISEDND